jgi:D-serine deaminase-like pyridoxal phosphate-dependent protein
MRVSDLDTPALLIDLDIMERNLCRAAQYANTHGLRLRPHTKTHKIPALGRRQLELGAAGLTVAKVGECEVMLRAGPSDVLVAYPVIGRPKLERLMAAARQTAVTVALDSLTAARGLSEAASAARLTVGVLTEVDVGLGRAGVNPGTELIELIRAVSPLPGLSFEGIAFYPGHIKKLDAEGLAEIDQLAALLETMLAGLRAAGIQPRIVSGGSTPALFHSHRLPGMNEIRPGTYIFNDKNTVLSGGCGYEDCAASILTTVVSTARQGQMLIDGGSKTFSSDRPSPAAEVTFGHLMDVPEALFTRMNEEHGYVDIHAAGREFRIGDRIRVIPNHVCAAMNLHETVYGIRGDTVEHTWAVEGRGKLQ